MSTQIDPRFHFNHPTPTILNWTRDPLTHHMPAASRVKTWPSGPGRPVLPDDGFVRITVPMVVPREALVHELRSQSVVDDCRPYGYATHPAFLPGCPYLVKVHRCNKGSSLDAEAVSRRAEPEPETSTLFDHPTPGTFRDDESNADTAHLFNPADILRGIAPTLPSWPAASEGPGTPGGTSGISLSASHISHPHSAAGSSTPTTIRRIGSLASDSWSFLENTAHTGRPVYHFPIASPNHTSMSAFVPRVRDDPNRRVAPFGTATIIHTGSKKQLAPDSSGLLKRRRSSSGTEKDATQTQEAERAPREKRTKLVNEDSVEIRTSTDHTTHPPSKLRNELHLAPLSSHYV